MKKVLSLILSLLMIFSCVSVATVSAYSADHLPQIYVEGLDSKRIYYKEDTAEENPLFFPIDGNMLLTNLMKYEKYLKEAVTKKDPNLLNTYISLWMDDCFGDIALEKDGATSSEKVWLPETELNPYGDNKYVFKFDCRLDPVDIAKELYEVYIPMVQKATGSQKFELVSSSFGTSIVLALVNEYPAVKEDIDSFLLCVPSVNGVNFAGELFSGNFDVDPAALKAFVETNVADDEISLLLSTLLKTGTLDFLLDSMVEPVLKAALLDALKNVVRDIFGTMPAMWTFVDDRYFYDALKYTYGEDYASEDHEYAGLISKITYYHENIKNRTYDIMSDLQASGIHTNIVCKYGNAPIPVSKEGNFLGDGFVAVEMASFGATCTMSGKKFADDYQQAKYPEKNYMSPDWCIDASTCLLPNNTWFIKNLNHGVKTDGYYEMLNTIIYDDLDVFTSERYPQYLIVPAEDDEAVVPLAGYMESTEQEEVKETTWLEDFLAFLKGIFPRLIEWIKGLFNK